FRAAGHLLTARWYHLRRAQWYAQHTAPPPQEEGWRSHQLRPQPPAWATAGCGRRRRGRLGRRRRGWLGRRPGCTPRCSSRLRLRRHGERNGLSGYRLHWRRLLRRAGRRRAAAPLIQPQPTPAPVVPRLLAFYAIYAFYAILAPSSSHRNWRQD